MGNRVSCSVTFKSADAQELKQAFAKATEKIERIDESVSFIRFAEIPKGETMSDYCAYIDYVDDDRLYLTQYNGWPLRGLLEFSTRFPNVKLDINVSAEINSCWARGVEGYIQNGNEYLHWVHTEEEMEQILSEIGGVITMSALKKRLTDRFYRSHPWKEDYDYGIIEFYINESLANDIKYSYTIKAKIDNFISDANEIFEVILKDEIPSYVQISIHHYYEDEYCKVFDDEVEQLSYDIIPD